MDPLSMVDTGVQAGTLAYNIFAGERAHKFMQEGRDREDTYHQRKVGDLEAAGLNPALAYSGSAGGSTPTPTQPVTDKQSNIFQNALKDLQLKQAKKQLAISDATINDINASAKLKNTQAMSTGMEELRSGERHPDALKKLQQEVMLIAEQIGKTHYESHHLRDVNVQQKILNSMNTLRRDYMTRYGAEMPSDDLILRDINKILDDAGFDPGKGGNARLIKTLAHLFKMFLIGK